MNNEIHVEPMEKWFEFTYSCVGKERITGKANYLDDIKDLAIALNASVTIDVRFRKEEAIRYARYNGWKAVVTKDGRHYPIEQESGKKELEIDCKEMTPTVIEQLKRALWNQGFDFSHTPKNMICLENVKL